MTLEDLKDRLNNTAAEALQWLMPAGYVSHNTFYCGDVFGTPASKGKPGSFTFHLQKLVGKDFASGDRGYFGVYDIFVAHAKGNQTDAIRLSREFLKLPPTDRPQINHHHERGARDMCGPGDALTVASSAIATDLSLSARASAKRYCCP